MTLYLDQMFNSGSTASSTLTSLFPGTTSSSGTYSPKANGTLLKLDIIVTPTAASSLCQSGYITLNCTSWTPVNLQTISFSGYGLATAPQLYGGVQAHNYYPPAGDGVLNWPVSTAVPITGQYVELFSAVTPSIQVMGLFSA